MKFDSEILYKMKQNQHLFRPFPHQNPTLKKSHDFLNSKIGCRCTACKKIVEKVNPEIVVDEQKIYLERMSKKQTNISDIVMFLEQYRKFSTNLPHFPFLDTFVLRNGDLDFMMLYQKHRLCISSSCSSLKTLILQRKKNNDLQYRKKKHMMNNLGFTFTQLDHESQKLIKQFENNYKFISSLLNRVVIVKLFAKEEEQIINLSEFTNLFDRTKQRSYSLDEIQYMQIFPIMAGEEEYSYVKQVKYIRERQCTKPNFKLAQYYFSGWYLKNQSQQKIQSHIINQLKHDEPLLLLYYTYKILIHFQYFSKIRIQSACLYYITNDSGKTFFLKNINYISAKQLLAIEQIKTQLPQKKQIPIENHIELKTEMRKGFNEIQTQFKILQDQRKKIEQELENDKKYSNEVYKKITKIEDKNFHKVLSSQSKKYKKQFLKLS